MIAVGRRGDVTAYLELTNLYNRGNVSACNYRWMSDGSGGFYLRRVPDYAFRLLPSLGITWSSGS